jgi:hypothetical protein
MTPDTLYVAWQDGESRRIMPVGRLIRAGGRYEFAYIQAARKAQEHGFEPLLSFPSLEGVYRSGFLPPLFSNRVMNHSREDYGDYVAELGLTRDQAEPFTVLSRSGGRRSTDKLEVFAPPTRTSKGVEGLFLARGVRHVQGSEEVIKTLKPGDGLRVIEDRENRVNPLALVLADDGARPFSFVPDYLASEFGHMGVDVGDMTVTVERVNPDPAPVHHRVLCRFCLAAERGGELFAGEDYKPISSDASGVAA